MNSQHLTQYRNITELRICFSSVSLITCMSPSVCRYRLSPLLYIPKTTDRLARNITAYYEYTVHTFRPLNLAAIRSSTCKKYAKKFIMIYHHNHNYHHHACKDISIVAVPVSTFYNPDVSLMGVLYSRFRPVGIS